MDRLLKALLVLFIMILQILRSQKYLNFQQKINTKYSWSLLLQDWNVGYQLRPMRKVINIAKKSIKIAAYSAIGFSITGFAYLQYVNSIIGPISIDKDDAVSFYKKDMNMSDGESERTYYWLLFRISLSRILRFHNYQSTCSQFLAKIVEPNLNNYKKANIIEQINSIPQIKNNKQNRKLFTKISQIRKGSTDTLQIRAYIIKQLRDLQKLLHTYKILNIPTSRQEEITKIYRYLCDAGCTFKDPQISKYVEKLPELEIKFPNDELHKIIFI